MAIRAGQDGVEGTTSELGKHHNMIVIMSQAHGLASKLLRMPEIY